MQREFGFGGLIRTQRISVWVTVAVGVFFLLLAGVAQEDADRWGWIGLAALVFVIAMGLLSGLRGMRKSAVIVNAQGLRYEHLPESELVPWTSIRRVRERPVLQRLDLIDAQGETCLQLHYQLVCMTELKAIVREHASIALPTPVRFRRSWGIDVFYILLSLIPPLVFLLLYETRRTPYAVQVTDSELILSFPFRTLTIPLQELKFASKTQHHRGMSIPLLEVEDPDKGKPIIIRNFPILALTATLKEAIANTPFARLTFDTKRR